MRRATNSRIGIARCARWLGPVALGIGLSCVMPTAAVRGDLPVPVGAPAPLAPPLARPPLDPPLGLTGGFGEYRIGHFHAGVDLSTGGRVGRPVFAPLSGSIERVRASGVGYGRSIYLRSDDGRLLQLGHLDAFAPPLDSYVAAAQESSGQYEQDLWPEAGRFLVRAGERVAWSGESGAGGPHLHFEIRRGDTAYHPLRAGLVIEDARAPELTSLTLEPLDDSSFVARAAAPLTVTLTARPETLVVEGRVRAIVGARDGVWSGVDRMVPWSVAMEWDGRRTECRFDSVSWATDMAEGDYVYDAGRVVGEKGIVMWAPAGWRPRVLVAQAPITEDAGTIAVGPGDAPRPLRLEARDLAGHVAERVVLLRGPRAPERGPDTTGAGGRAVPIGGEARFVFAALPGNAWRVTYRGAPRGSRGVRMVDEATGVRDAGRRGDDWSVVLSVGTGGLAGPWRFEGRGEGGRIWRDEGPALDLALGSSGGNRSGSLTWSAPPETRFEQTPIGSRAVAEPSRGAAELVPLRGLGRLEPENLPLRGPLTLRFESGRTSGLGQLGLFRMGSDGWEWVGAKAAGAGSFEAVTRRLGTFALFGDTLAPRVFPLASARRAARGSYNRWSLEARIEERGSGVDARESYVRIDGTRRPAEWDSEQGILRWRPARAPRRGVHRFEFVVTDRTANVARRRGRFVID